MGNIKKYWLLSFNRLLSLTLMLLGFGSCDEERKDMYGMPPARFSVKANVLDEMNNPLEGIKVDIKAEEASNVVVESGLTNAKGLFVALTDVEQVNIVCADATGEKNGAYQKDSVQVDFAKQDDLEYEFTIHLKEDR